MTDEEMREIRERLFIMTDTLAEFNARMAKQETKMNLIAYIAGASYGAVALTLITVAWTMIH